MDFLCCDQFWMYPTMNILLSLPLPPSFALKNYYTINKYILHIQTPRTEGESYQKVAKVVIAAVIMMMIK